VDVFWSPVIALYAPYHLCIFVGCFFHVIFIFFLRELHNISGCLAAEDYIGVYVEFFLEFLPFLLILLLPTTTSPLEF